MMTLKEKIAKVLAEKTGTNASTTVAWLSRPEWEIVLPESLQSNREIQGKAKNFQPTLVVLVETDASGAGKVQIRQQTERVNSNGDPLPPVLEIEAIDGFSPAWNDTGALTRESSRELAKFQATLNRGTVQFDQPASDVLQAYVACITPDGDGVLVEFDGSDWIVEKTERFAGRDGLVAAKVRAVEIAKLRWV